MLIDLSNYVLEPLREGEEYILYSGRRDGELPAILVVAPVSEYPALESLLLPVALQFKYGKHYSRTST